MSVKKSEISDLQHTLQLTSQQESILKEITAAKSTDDLNDLKYGMAILKVIK